MSIGHYRPLALKELIPTWLIIFWEWTVTRETWVTHFISLFYTHAWSSVLHDKHKVKIYVPSWLDLNIYLVFCFLEKCLKETVSQLKNFLAMKMNGVRCLSLTMLWHMLISHQMCGLWFLGEFHTALYNSYGEVVSIHCGFLLTCFKNIILHMSTFLKF